MAEVARYGFECFGDRLKAAWAGGDPSPLEELEAVGRAYLSFARVERPPFEAMFQPGLPDNPALKAEADRAFGVLENACRRANACQYT